MIKKLYVNFIKMKNWTFTRVWGTYSIYKFGEDLSRHYAHVYLRTDFKLINFFNKESVFFKLKFKPLFYKSDLDYKIWFNPINFLDIRKMGVAATTYRFFESSVRLNKFFYLNEFWFSASMPSLSISNYELNSGIDLISLFDSDWRDGLLSSEGFIWNSTLSSLLSLGNTVNWWDFL